MDDPFNMTSFDEIGEWIAANADRLWINAFDRPVPKGFSIRCVTMGNPSYSEDVTGTGAGGFNGTMHFSASTKISLEDACCLFRETGIIVHQKMSWATQSDRGFAILSERKLFTHTLRYTMLGEEWLNLAVYKRLAA